MLGLFIATFFIEMLDKLDINVYPEMWLNSC